MTYDVIRVIHIAFYAHSSPLVYARDIFIFGLDQKRKEMRKSGHLFLIQCIFVGRIEENKS